MKFNQAGFLSAAVGATILILFVGFIYLQRSIIQNVQISESPVPQPTPSTAEAKFINNTKHLAVSVTPSPLVKASSSPNNSNAINLTPTASPTSIASPTPTSTLSPRSVKILAPNGGEVIKVGQELSISWDYSGVSQCVIIYMLEDGTKSTMFIPVDPAKKSYQLPIMSDYLGLLDQVQLKIEMSCYSEDGNHAEDMSDGYFTVKK